MVRILIVISLIIAAIIAISPFLSPFNGRIEQRINDEIAALQQATLDNLRRAEEIRAQTLSVSQIVKERFQRRFDQLSALYAAIAIMFIGGATLFAVLVNQFVHRRLAVDLTTAYNSMLGLKEQRDHIRQWYYNLLVSLNQRSAA